MDQKKRFAEAEKAIRDLARELRAGDKALAAHTELVAAGLRELAVDTPGKYTRDFNIEGAEIGFETQFAGIDALEQESLQERVIGARDFIPAYFLVKGAKVQRAVARVQLTEPYDGFPQWTAYGSGFMVAPGLFMTNNHVIPDLDAASKMRMQFNYQMSADGDEVQPQNFVADLSGTFRTNEALDYTLVRLSPSQGAMGGNAGDLWNWLPLNGSQQYGEDMRLNIIQHPRGRRKEVVLQDNRLSKIFENTIRYFSDTENGSSGSPVFDNLWKLVALHHAGGEKNDQGVFIDNQGIRIDRIVDDLRQAFNSEPGVLAELGI